VPTLNDPIAFIVHVYCNLISSLIGLVSLV
jgi:hypothetical protein